MHKKDYCYLESEKAINKVLVAQDKTITSIESTLNENDQKLNESIRLAEDTLKSLEMGKEVVIEKNRSKNLPSEKKIYILRNWDSILEETEKRIPYDVSLKEIFTDEELTSNEEYLIKLRNEFNAIHRLDAVDYAICGVSGILSAAIDILLVGMPESPLAGVEGGSLSNFIRRKIEESLPPSEIKKLEKEFWVPYDPSTNRNLRIPVEGLSTYFHRFQSLGHDPILGFVFGVLDVMNGTFTAIDKNGKFTKQVAANQETVGMKVFDAIDLVFGHMKSDIATPRGLPAPFMTMFNLFQFGSIGEDGLSIAEVARSMYGQGYDFTHFLSMSVPVAINEALVRGAYCIKRVKEGHKLIESLPFDLPFSKKPKLSTMLFISHSIATAANAGKIAFTENPLSINYAQWLAFAKYSISQLKWVLLQKPALRNKYVQGFIDSDWKEIDCAIQDTWDELTQDAIVLRALL